MKKVIGCMLTVMLFLNLFAFSAGANSNINGEKSMAVRVVPLRTVKKMHEIFVHLLILSHTVTSRENVRHIFH